MTSIQLTGSKYYLFGSRIFTHIIFWLVYYISFSFIWASDNNYYASFGLEFTLMPIRISASYITIYYLIPNFLLKNDLKKFLSYLIVTLLIAGILQRIFIHFFHELFFEDGSAELWSFYGVLRAIILINSTVLFLSAIKMYQYWKTENERNEKTEDQIIEIRAEKRTYRIQSADITYLEGLGNYVTYYFTNRKPLISYTSLKDAESSLPPYFERIHKSFIVNKRCIESYTADNVEIMGRILPIGKSVDVTF